MLMFYGRDGKPVPRRMTAPPGASYVPTTW